MGTNKRNKNEKLIITISCISTVVIALGFTLMQGTIKGKDEHYVSQETDTKTETTLSKDSYEIIQNENIEKSNQYVVFEKKSLNSQQISMLVNEIEAQISENLKIYIFTNEEDALNFDGTEEKIEKLVTSKDNNLEISTYNYIENEIEVIPEVYTINSVKTENEETKIELEMNETNEPKEAIAYIKFLGESIKELNEDKDLGNLNIKAYHKEDNSIRWEYSSEEKTRVIKIETIEM